jgi:hypothetical protein
MRHGKCFSGTGHTQQNLMLFTTHQVSTQGFYGIRLVTRWCEVRN